MIIITCGTCLTAPLVTDARKHPTSFRHLALQEPVLDQSIDATRLRYLPATWDAQKGKGSASSANGLWKGTCFKPQQKHGDRLQQLCLNKIRSFMVQTSAIFYYLTENMQIIVSSIRTAFGRQGVAATDLTMLWFVHLLGLLFKHGTVTGTIPLLVPPITQAYKEGIPRLDNFKSCYRISGNTFRLQ